jgi:hypothetical protein
MRHVVAATCLIAQRPHRIDRRDALLRSPDQAAIRFKQFGDGRTMKIFFWPIIMALMLLGGVSTAQAADTGGTRFWNLTGETITHLSMAPAGTTNWGPDQCRNDPDGTVDFDERLRITGISSGRFDVRFADKTGRNCIVKDVDVKAGAVFSIGKEALDHCTQK